MNTNNTSTCGACGRPFVQAKPTCKCFDGCATEYSCGMPTCIRKGADPCKAKAVIPAITTETVDGISNLANCFVHVTNINTTFYIDDKHRPMIIWSGNVNDSFPEDITTPEEMTAYVMSNPLNLRNQFAYYRGFDTDTGKTFIDAIYYDNTGKAFWAAEFEEMTEE